MLLQLLFIALFRRIIRLQPKQKNMCFYLTIFLHPLIFYNFSSSFTLPASFFPLFVFFPHRSSAETPAGRARVKFSKNGLIQYFLRSRAYNLSLWYLWPFFGGRGTMIVLIKGTSSYLKGLSHEILGLFF